jgi:hypothetical protein
LPTVTFTKENGDTTLFVNRSCIETDEAGHVKNMDRMLMYSAVLVRSAKAFHERLPLRSEFQFRFLFDAGSGYFLLGRKLGADLDQNHDFYNQAFNVLIKMNAIKSSAGNLLKGLIKVSPDDEIELAMTTVYKAPKGADDEYIFSLFTLFALGLKKFGAPNKTVLHDYVSIDEYKRFAEFLKKLHCSNLKQLLILGLDKKDGDV